MAMRIGLVLVSLALGGCAAIPDPASPGGPWPRTGAAIDHSTRAEITDLYARYALFADANLGEAYASLFSERAEIVMGELRITGREALARRVGDKKRQTIHLQGTPVLVQLTPDLIIARTPVILGTQAMRAGPLESPADEPTFRFSFYEDELIRTAQGWRFRHRSALPSPTPAEGFLRGH